MRFITILLIVMTLGLISCESKKGRTGGFNNADNSRRNLEGFNGGVDQQPYDPLQYYLAPCLVGRIEPVPTMYFGHTPTIQLLIDLNGVDGNGWKNDDSAKPNITLKGDFTDLFDINDKTCIRFSNPSTHKMVEYWYQRDARTWGANLSFELSGINEILQPGVGSSGSGNDCVLFGKPIRMDVRLIFTNLNEGEPGPVTTVRGSYTLFYANIQKALAAKSKTRGVLDERVYDPHYCCHDWVERWTVTDNQGTRSEEEDHTPPLCKGEGPNTEVELLASRDLAFFSGAIDSLESKFIGQCDFATACTDYQE